MNTSRIAHEQSILSKHIKLITNCITVVKQSLY